VVFVSGSISNLSMKSFSDLLDSLCSSSNETTWELSNLYGIESIKYQTQRYAGLIERFIKLYSDSPHAVVVRAPGRVNLIGEHTDYNGLPVMPMAINRDILMAASARSDHRIHLKNMDHRFEDREYEILPQITPFAKGDWGNYSKAGIQTVVDYLDSQRGSFPGLPGGMNLLVSADLPASGGLSSSSALVVANALALLYLNQIELQKDRLADLLAKGERYVGTEGGGMDQAASLLGKKGCALKIDFFPLRVKPVPLASECTVIIVNSLIKADKTQATMEDYNRRPRECRLIIALLNAALREAHGEHHNITRLAEYQHLRLPPQQKQVIVDQVLSGSPFGLNELSQKLGKSIRAIEAEFLTLKDGRILSQPRVGFPLRERYRHVISEAARVEAAALALEQRQVSRVGELMYESHRSCAEDFEISCPELDQLVEISRQADALGARLTGAGFGGCIVALVENSRAGDFIEAIRREYFFNYMKAAHPEVAVDPQNLSDFILTCAATEGAGRVFA
jgi:N-acetylgalactosamine kinase